MKVSFAKFKKFPVCEKFRKNNIVRIKREIRHKLKAAGKPPKDDCDLTKLAHQKINNLLKEMYKQC